VLDTEYVTQLLITHDWYRIGVHLSENHPNDFELADLAKGLPIEPSTLRMYQNTASGIRPEWVRPDRPLGAFRQLLKVPIEVREAIVAEIESHPEDEQDWREYAICRRVILHKRKR